MTQRSKDKWEIPESFKKDWIKALKSGNYIQASGVLREDEEAGLDTVGYCCLGVACSVAGVENIDIHGEWIDEFHEDGNTHGDYQPFENIPTILKGCSDDSELVRILSEMNDAHTRDTSEHKFSFVEIADWIDENIRGI